MRPVGRLMLVREGQLEKAQSSIAKMLVGSTTFERLLQYKRALIPIDDRLLGNMIVDRLEQPTKAP